MIPLPLDVYSPDQVSALIMELRSYIDALADDSRRTRHSEHGPDKSELLASVFEAARDRTPEQLVEDLEEILKDAPVVHITTVILPNHKLKQQLTDWFRRDIHMQTLLTFTERRDIGGGVVVRAGSNVYDFSLKRSVINNKHRITELAFPKSPAQPQPETPKNEVANV